MATEAKPAATASATTAAKTAEKVVPKAAAAPKEAATSTASTAASASQKAVPKQGVPPQNPNAKAPKGGKAPKKVIYPHFFRTHRAERRKPSP